MSELKLFEQIITNNTTPLLNFTKSIGKSMQAIKSSQYNHVAVHIVAGDIQKQNQTHNLVHPTHKG